MQTSHLMKPARPTTTPPQNTNPPRTQGHRGDGCWAGAHHRRNDCPVPHQRAARPHPGRLPRLHRRRVDTAVSTWLIILTIIGAVGVVGWLWSIWIVAMRKYWARWAATAMFVLGIGVAVTNLLVKDTSGDTGLAPMLGWIGMLPCLAGLVAVALLWRRSS